MNAMTKALFHAAARGDRTTVERLLLDPRVDVLARDERGASAADRVSVGDVSMDPGDVNELRALAKLLRRAADRARQVQVEGAPDVAVERLLRAHVARVAPSPADHGGGTLTARCAPWVDETGGASGREWRVALEGRYDGALPSSDPPWRLDAELRVWVDPDIGLRELARLRWESS